MDKKELNKGYRYVDTDSVLQEDSELFLKALESIQKTGCAYPSVMKSEMYPIKPVTHLTVLDIMRFIDDTQNVAIFDSKTYNLDCAIYKGEAQNIPHKFIDLRVSYFYSDCSYIDTFSGSFIGIRICN